MSFRNHRLSWSPIPVVVIYVFSAPSVFLEGRLNWNLSQVVVISVFFCEERVSAVRTGEPFSVGVLSEVLPGRRADVSFSSSVSGGDSMSEFAGEFPGEFWCFLVAELSDIERRRFPDFCVLLGCF